MLKPYAERVQSTKKLLEVMLRFTHEHAIEIKENKEIAIQTSMAKREDVLQWYNDTSNYDLIEFNGYRARQEKSSLTGHQQIYYDRQDPWTDFIPFYNYFNPYITVQRPDYYIVPAAWEEVIERLRISDIEMLALTSDTLLKVEAYYIEDFQTTERPYNGHYWHYATKVRRETVHVQLYAGDFLIPVVQRGAAYLVHTLEPQAYDSFFSWNFFDAVLMRQEYFSPYLFEKTALEILENKPELKKEFDSKKRGEPSFSASAYAQLRWIYEHSPWSEATYRRYPVYRLYGELNL